MPFYGDLQYERVPDKDSFVGRPIYRLTAYLGYANAEVSSLLIPCDPGFETDFASIPEWIFFIRPRNGKWRKASVIHDKACDMAADEIISYSEADRIFYYAMLEDQASKFTAWLLYLFCRVNHLYVKGK